MNPWFAEFRRHPLRWLLSKMPLLALLVIVAAIPYALLDTWHTGRIYIFSREFLDELPRRFHGAGRFRFVLQPAMAVLLGARGGLMDARAGNPPYLFGLLSASGRRRELFNSGVETIGTLLAMGIILDVVFQAVLYRAVHPAAALLLGPVLICAPYAIARALTGRLARRFARTKGPP